MKAGISKVIFLIWFVLFSVQTIAEINNTGIPAIQNFTRKTYKASTQNWGVAQNKNGFMYFANNDGLIEYDGIYWNLYQFSEPVLTRSVAIDDTGTIFVGMVNEFGAVRTDKHGKLKFTSFRKKLPDTIEGDIGDVWKIHVTDKGVFFQTQNQLIWFDTEGKLIKIFYSAGNFRYSFCQDNRLFIHELGKGIFELAGNELMLISGTETLSEFEVWSLIIGTDGRIIIGTARNGVYIYSRGELKPWLNPVNDILKSAQIFSACRLFDSSIAFGTVQDGVFVISETGELLHHFNNLNGLQNNTILSMSTDDTGNLWLGLDNGIDYIEINSPVSYLFHSEGFGAGYSVSIHKGYLYLGTNNGLFATPWPNKNKGSYDNFIFIKNTVGQIWHLGVYDDILLCGHDDGTFLIDGLQAKKISDVKGVWKFLKLKEYPDFLIGGTYHGLILFEKSKLGKTWQFKTKIKGFDESSRVIEEEENGIIWMTHGFKGVFKITLNNKLDSVLNSGYFGTESGFASSNYINVFKINGKPVFTSREGIFSYNTNTGKFEKELSLEKLFETNEHISYLKQDENLNIWFVSGGKPKMLKNIGEKEYSLVKSPFEGLHNQMVAGFESLYCTRDGEVFYCLVNGFAHYQPYSKQSNEKTFNTYIRKVEILHENQVYFGGEKTLIIDRENSHTPEFRFHRNRIRFLFTTPRFHGKREMEFSYQLNNFAEEWSSWSLNSSCEFANLAEGKYIFKVKARDPNGGISESDTFSFRIKPPWFRSMMAYIFYSFVLIATILLVIWFLFKRIEISKRKERLKHLKEYRSKEQQYHREALIAEKEIIKLRNEKLQVEMIHRDKELANQTLNLIQKNEFLLNLKEDLRKLSPHFKEESAAQKLAHLVRRIDKDIDNEKHWSLFESAFDEVHEDFMKKLKDKYPELSAKDLRLCAYLRMNLSTKELAALINISERGVEISRYRLRKKLKLDRDINLTGFMTDF